MLTAFLLVVAVWKSPNKQNCTTLKVASSYVFVAGIDAPILRPAAD
jgi:hypothetical protein